MLKVENVEVFNFDGAIRGMRNPLNSWAKSDSNCSGCRANENKDSIDCESCHVYIGKNDLDLMKRLCKAGSEHRKFLRQIFVSMDITAPLYWWKEADTYKVGTVANSCSTMHKIAAKEFTLDDFSCEHLLPECVAELRNTIDLLNLHRELFNNKAFDDPKINWWQMIQMLPSSYNQKRTITMNYENVVTIIKQRSGHKLDEWHTLVDELLKLPYMRELSDACMSKPPDTASNERPNPPTSGSNLMIPTNEDAMEQWYQQHKYRILKDLSEHLRAPLITTAPIIPGVKYPINPSLPITCQLGSECAQSHNDAAISAYNAAARQEGKDAAKD